MMKKNEINIVGGSEREKRKLFGEKKKKQPTFSVLFVSDFVKTKRESKKLFSPFFFPFLFLIELFAPLICFFFFVFVFVIYLASSFIVLSLFVFVFVFGSNYTSLFLKATITH